MTYMTQCLYRFPKISNMSKKPGFSSGYGLIKAKDSKSYWDQTYSK